jgi:hypothetical protein
MVKQEEILLRQALLKDLWLNFFRLHQIYKELSVKKIIISKLQKVLVNYNARKFLSPDMRLEERIFSMVTKNFSLVQDLLERERIGILSFFTEITSYKCPISKIKSEDTDINWPKLNRLSALTQIEPLPLKLAQSEFEFAESQIRLAESRKVPLLRFGPVTQSFVNDEVNNTMSGIAFVMPLPFFDRNQTQRLQTLLDQRYAGRRVEVTKLKEDFIFETNLKKYKSGLAVLTQVGEIDRSLEVMEKLASSFSEGKVSIPNIVEFCRQLDDLVSRYHGGESALMRDLLDLYEQRGLLSKETLQEML